MSSANQPRLLTNLDVGDEHPEAQVIAARQQVSVRMRSGGQGVHIFTLSDQDPGVVLKPEHAAPHAGFNKAKDFQSVHKGSASPEVKANVLDAYGMTEDAFKQQMSALNPMRRFGRPEEVAGAALFLASAPAFAQAQWDNVPRIVAIADLEGDYDKFVGRVQERYGDKKDEIVRWADDWYRRQGQSSPAQREAQRPR